MKMKALKVLSWALGAVLVASVAWAAVGWRVDDYGNIKNGRSSVILSEGQAVNCRLSISGSTLSVVGSDGNALSASNPCVVGVRNSTGTVVAKSFTSAVSVTFGAASNTDGNLFGITDANWADAMNIKLGVIYNDTDAYFTISRLPLYVSGAAAGTLCEKDDTDCDAQGDAMILVADGTLNLANWVNLPITQVGWFPGTYATAGGAWTFATTAPAGFNFEYRKLIRTMPVAQMGAAAGTHGVANGGTPCVWTTEAIYYREQPDGMVFVFLSFTGDGGADGAGAVSAEIALPFIHANPGATVYSYNSVSPIAGGTSYFNGTIGVMNSTSYVVMTKDATTALLWSNFSNGTRQVITSLFYPTMQ